jgi:AraC-like DNA-binding protein
VSTRTLHRRLEAAGCSFRDLVESTRQARAETFLRNPDISLAEIAFMLGYSEQSTFHNAFKRWTGKTPNEFRSAVA